MLRPSSSIVTGTRVLGTRQENMRITGEGETLPAPKLPVMPTTPPVDIGAISRPSSAERLLLVVLGRDLDHDLAAVLRPRMRPVGRLAADDFYAEVAVVAHVLLAEHAARLLDDGIGAVPALGHRLAAAQHEDRAQFVAVGPGGRDLVAVGRRAASGARHAHLVLADLFVSGAGEVAHHVGHHVGARIADLVQHLLGHGGGADQPAGAVGLAKARTSRRPETSATGKPMLS